MQDGARKVCGERPVVGRIGGRDRSLGCKCAVRYDAGARAAKCARGSVRACCGGGGGGGASCAADGIVVRCGGIELEYG